jgi:hypothetical protein
VSLPEASPDSASRCRGLFTDAVDFFLKRELGEVLTILERICHPLCRGSFVRLTSPGWAEDGGKTCVVNWIRDQTRVNDASDKHAKT